MSFALELRDVRKSFGKSEIIRGANLAVQAGERVAIIGPNGAGKSTLFNLISGRFAPTSGEIHLHGARIDGRKPYEINRQGLSRSFQVSSISCTSSSVRSVSRSGRDRSAVRVSVKRSPDFSMRNCMRSARSRRCVSRSLSVTPAMIRFLRLSGHNRPRRHAVPAPFN